MNRCVRIMLAAMWGGTAAWCPASGVHAGETLTLQSSLERTLNNNPRLLSAQKDLSISQAQLREAKSLFYPKVNLNLDYVRYRNETIGLTSPELGNAVLEAPIANSAGERANPLSENLYLGRLGFLQTLYSGGKLTYTLKRSKAGVKRAESSFETLKQHAAYETASTFYRLLALKEEQKVLSDALFQLEKLNKSERSAHGRLAAMELRSDLRKQLGDLKQQHQTVHFDYLRSMGMELFSDIEVEGTLDCSPPAEDVQTALVWAKQNRAELKETLIQEEVDQLSVDLSLTERYPVFLLGGGVELRNDELPLEESNWNAVLSMNIPLFDGFSSKARVRESRSRADQSRLRRVQLEDEVEMQVRSAMADCQHWQQEKVVRQEELAAVKQAKNRYFGSNRTSDSFAEQLDYMRWMVKANNDFIEAQYEFCMARARLAKAMGRPLSEI